MQYLNIMEDFNKVSESVEAIQADSNTIKDEGNVLLTNNSMLKAGVGAIVAIIILLLIFKVAKKKPSSPPLP